MKKKKTRGKPADLEYFKERWLVQKQSSEGVV